MQTNARPVALRSRGMVSASQIEAGTPPILTKTKIVCTLGPKSRSVEMIEALLRAGMSIARFNFSHGAHEYHQETLDALHRAQQNTGLMCAVLLDTKGPEIRTGFLKDGKPIEMTRGKEVTLSTDYDLKGDHDCFAISYPYLARDVEPGKHILIADGSLDLEVLSCDEFSGTVRARCQNSATIGERKNVNLPGVKVDLPTLTDKDVSDLVDFGVANDIDFVAASFVRQGKDVENVRSVLGDAGKHIKIISKVENQEGLVNFDQVLSASDGVMVARGDLGMEIPTEKIFLAQKVMIKKCNTAGKPVVTATQMLESMVKNPRPTRAEATDVANAVLDGTDCVMLSGETAAGAYPEEAVKVMSKICREAEASIDSFLQFKSIMQNTPLPMTPLESLASSAVRTAHKVKASLIVVLTRGGSTARLVAKYRPAVPILTVAVPVLTTGVQHLCLCGVEHVFYFVNECLESVFADSLTWSCSGETPARQCQSTRGLIPLLAEASAKANDTDTTDEILSASVEQARAAGYCGDGDCVVALHRIGAASVIKIVSV